jgi:hypothetical protein
MKTLLTLVVFLFAAVAGNAQLTSYTGFVMTEKPVLHTIEKEFENESAVFVKDSRKLEIVPTKDGASFYTSFHKIIRINDEKGLESFNKIYIPVSAYMEIVSIKARAINHFGKVIDVQPDAIKDYTDDDNQQYKIFAIDGLGNGSEVEYMYTMKRSPYFFGKETFQMRFPVQGAELEIVTPAGIKFEAKAYNSQSQPEEKTDDSKGVRIIYFSSKNIPAYTEEKYAMIGPALLQVQYKLSYTQSKGMNTRMFTWSELAKSVYEIYNDFTKKEKEAANWFYKKVDVKDGDNEEQKIRKIEHYVKLNIKTGEDVDGDDFDDFDKIKQNKIASTRGICRLTAAMLQKAGIPYEVVITGDRGKYLIEKKFEYWNNAQNIILHFPATGKYIAPSAFLYRYPFIPPGWAGANAMYCAPVEVGDVKSALAEIKVVPIEPANQTLHNIESVLSFNKGMDTVFVEAKHIHTGYTAPLYKAQLLFLPPDDQKSFMKEMARNSAKTETILSQTVANKELDVTESNKPFVITLKLASVDLIESAGNKILLKIGDCIGPQVEMYNERERIFDIEIDYPHLLERKLVLEIPAGYKVKNPEDAVFNISYSTNNKVTMAFISSYQLVDNKLEITISEQYNQLRWPKADVNDYMKVVNAAADFNKVVLVLEKK